MGHWFWSLGRIKFEYDGIRLISVLEMRKHILFQVYRM